MNRLLVVGIACLAGCWRSPPPTPEPLAVPGLHNVFRLTPGVYSGSGPDGDAGFAALAALGVRTVISVDGAAPDVAAAKAHGLRYVHVPVGYDGVPDAKARLIAKAVRDLPGPVYVHCHHGLHRGPAATAAALLCLDPTWTPAAAAEWMRAAGTDPKYRGLVGLPGTLRRPSGGELDRLPGNFPETVPTAGVARAMVDIDAIWDRMKATKPGTPADAVLLREAYRELARSPDAARRGPDFLRELRLAEDAAAGWETTASAFARSAAVCSRCHSKFRD